MRDIGIKFFKWAFGLFCIYGEFNRFKLEQREFNKEIMIEILRIRWDAIYSESKVKLTDDLYKRACAIYDPYHNKYKANSYVSIEFAQLTERYKKTTKKRK
jgi:hypothetical protein